MFAKQTARNRLSARTTVVTHIRRVAQVWAVITNARNRRSYFSASPSSHMDSGNRQSFLRARLLESFPRGGRGGSLLSLSRRPKHRERHAVTRQTRDGTKTTTTCRIALTAGERGFLSRNTCFADPRVEREKKNDLSAHCLPSNNNGDNRACLWRRPRHDFVAVSGLFCIIVLRHGPRLG